MIPRFKFWLKETNLIYTGLGIDCYTNTVRLVDEEMNGADIPVSKGVFLPAIDDLKSIEGEALVVGDIIVIEDAMSVEKMEIPKLEEIADSFWSDLIYTMIYFKESRSCYALHDLSGKVHLCDYHHPWYLAEECSFIHCRDSSGKIMNIFTHDVASAVLFEIMGIER